MSGSRMIRIENLTIHLGEFNLCNVNLSIDEGEYLVLLGPTGAGKSILLECLVGIYSPSGNIVIKGKNITRLYPEERNVGYVPQDYALFPNMTVRQNVGYGLRARRVPPSDITKHVSCLMNQLGIHHLEHRLPLHLSGGEKQRVALGRALITQPSVLLLDEPLSALDENLRFELAKELKKIQQKSKSTFLHVCHSLEEASFVADRIAIMRHGTIEQVGTIEEILKKPASLFIAEFTRTRNFFEGTAEKVTGGCRIKTQTGATFYSSQQSLEGPVTVGIRPEEISVRSESEPPIELNMFKARVIRTRRMPSYIEVELDAGFPLIMFQPWQKDNSEQLSTGKNVDIHVRPEAVLVFSKVSGTIG